jgi:hypothetical protein
MNINLFILATLRRDALRLDALLLTITRLDALSPSVPASAAAPA